MDTNNTTHATSFPAHAVNNTYASESSFRFRSIAAALLYFTRTTPDAIFLVSIDDTGTRHEYSFQSFAEVVLRRAATLQSLGVHRGSRIVSAAHNHHDTVILMFAAWTLGACIVPLNMTEDDDRLRFIIGDCRAVLAVTRPEYAARMRPMCADANLPCVDSHDISFGAAVIEQLFTPDEDSFLEDECLIVYTSGTTGKPKGVVLVQRNLMADGEGIASWHGINPTQRMMCVLPIHHVNGTIVTLVTPFLAGASVVLLRKFQSDTFFTTIRREGVTITSVVPTLLAFLLQAESDDCEVRQHGFRHIICGAGPLTCELAQRFESTYAIPIIHGYGLSETTCYSCFLETTLDKQEHQFWMQNFGFPSIGTPISQNEMSIHDSHGSPCGENVRGEIVIRGWNVMKEYYNNESANVSAFEFGWFRSGDEGFWVMSGSGKPYFFITGRLKELIIRGGVNIAPLEIDEVLTKAPGVRAGICLGFENDFYGEEVGALVIPEAGCNADEVRDYCMAHLPFSKAPKVVLFADTLPVTSTGKYQRNNVKHLFKEWKAAQFTKSPRP